MPVRIRDTTVDEARRLNGGSAAGLGPFFRPLALHHARSSFSLLLSLLPSIAGFPDRMQNTLGKCGELTGIRANNSLRVTVKGSCDTFNPCLVEHAPVGYEADRRCRRGHQLIPAPGREGTACAKV